MIRWGLISGVATVAVAIGFIAGIVLGFLLAVSL